jgi:hypothetical protein
MMLDQIAAYANVVSALAVIVGLIYAALQIRQNTQAITTTAYQQVVSSFAEYAFEIAKDGELADLAYRAGIDFDSLTDVERMRYELFLLSFLRRAENVLYHADEKVLSDRHWAGIRNSIQTTLDQPGARQGWARVQHRVNPEFRAFIDRLLADSTDADPRD